MADHDDVLIPSSVVGLTMPREDSHKVLLQREGKHGFKPSKEGSEKITEIIRKKMVKFAKSWKCISESERHNWFKEWKCFVTWDPRDEHFMWRAFNKKGGKRLSEIYRTARILEQRPDWMSDQFWTELSHHWESEGFKKRSAANKKNRAVERKGATYRGGCVSMGTHAMKLAKKLKRQPTQKEIFDYCYLKRMSMSSKDDQTQDNHAEHEEPHIQHTQSLREDSRTPDIVGKLPEMNVGTNVGGQVQVMSNQLSVESVTGPCQVAGQSASLEQKLLDLRRHITMLEANVREQVELMRKEREQQHLQMVQLMQEFMKGFIQGNRKRKRRSRTHPPEASHGTFGESQQPED